MKISNVDIDEFNKLKEQVEILSKQNMHLVAKNTQLLQDLKHLMHLLYGRKSEKFTNPDQLDLFGDQIPEEPQSEPTAEDENTGDEEGSGSTKKRKPPKRRDLKQMAESGKYEVEEVAHHLNIDEQSCDHCNNGLDVIGQDEAYMLERIPARLKIIKNIRFKYACKPCEMSVKLAPLPLWPIPKSMASSSLLAYTIVAKFCDHLPLYRQANMWARDGFDINRSTLCSWLLKCSQLVKPLIDLMTKDIKSGQIIQMDESYALVMNESNRSNKTKSYMWVYKGGHLNSNLVVFDYQPTRSGKIAKQFLSEFKGYVQTDGYAGYDFIDKTPNIEHVNCMAHARRKFMDVVKKTTSKSSLAHQAVAMIGQLYKIERQAKDMTTNERFIIRSTKSKPIMNEIKIWLDKHIMTVLPKSETGKAIAYMHKRWNSIYRYLEHGDISIDNNGIENEIRRLALGRKNYSFVGSPDGAKAAANFYSLIATCNTNNIEPYKYFKVMFDKIRYCNNDADLRSLLPQNIVL